MSSVLSFFASRANFICVRSFSHLSGRSKFQCFGRWNFLREELKFAVAESLHDVRLGRFDVTSTFLWFRRVQKWSNTLIDAKVLWAAASYFWLSLL